MQAKIHKFFGFIILKTKIMSKKRKVFSDAAIELLSSPEGKQLLMAFFGIKDRRTVETHLANNVPSCIFLNLNIGEVIRVLAPDMKDSQLFREETNKEAEKRRSILVGKVSKHDKNEKNGENNQNAE